MNVKAWLASPLAGTALVLAALAVVSIPLRRLTSAPAASVSQAAEAGVEAGEIPAVLRVKLLTPAKRVTVESSDGDVLLELADCPAGESEHDTRVDLGDGDLELRLIADFGERDEETAVFLTVMPDGYEGKTGFATGAGSLDETLGFDWSHNH